MNTQLQTLLDFFQQNKTLSAEEKLMLEKTIKKAKSDFEISEFKLERTEKVKRTTAILLEETIEELEQKRKAVETQNKELEIESALERVRAVAMSMRKPDDMLQVCRTISVQLELLKVKEIRNVQTAIFYKDKGRYMNYEYYAKHNKTFITETTYTNNEIHQAFAEKMQKGNGEFFVTHLKGGEVKDWLSYQKTTNVFIDDYLNTASSLNYYWFSLGPVALGISTYNPLNGDEENLFKRFLKVFELSYRRYLDIEKAEAQARESQIQLALERVRARTMAMQKSDELSETAYILFQQFKDLGEDPIQITIGIFNEDKKVIQFSITGFDGSGSKIDQAYNMDIDESILLHKIYIAWKEQKKSVVIELAGKELNDWFVYRNKTAGLTESVTFNADDKRFVGVGFFSKGMISFSKPNRIPEETIKILERFAKVFEQTYTRFLDLQKAEAQARESQIQLAMERVRARTMAMQQSDELREAAALLFQQAKALGVPAYSCGYNIWEKDEKEFTSWMSTQDGSIINGVTNIPLTEDANFIRYVESKQNGEAFFVLELRGERMQEHYQYLKTIPAFKGYFDYAVSVGFDLPKTQIHYLANFSHGNLLFISLEPCPEFHDVFKRFASVFEQTYTRFLDLQKAEAQAREAQIEVSLERVRSRAMGMQNSEELKALIGTVFTELTKLDIAPTRCVIKISEGNNKGFRWWMANSETPDMPMSFFVKYTDMPFFNDFIKGWQERSLRWQYVLEGDNKIKTDNFLFTETELSQLPEVVITGMRAPARIFISSSFNTFGDLRLASLEPLNDEHFDILIRFAKVFDLTYTRFNDLQKAEAQAREAKIEAALERVRSKAMSMHSSRDLADTIVVFYHEVELLSITPRRCGVGLMDKETHFAELSTMNTTEHGDSIEIIGKLKLTGHPVLERIYDNWILQKEYHPVLLGNEIKEYYQLIRPQIAYPDYPTDTAQYGYFFFFNEGGVYAWTKKKLSEDELKIYRRFTSVLSLTYKRYKDLKDAEANAREAIKRASLDRVRAETASMRTTGDLEKITPLIWNELTTLGVPFIRCGVFIMDEQQEQIHSFLSTPDGKAIAAFQLHYDTAGALSKVLVHWHKKEMFKDHWDEAAFAEWTKSLVEQGAIASEEKYLATHRPANLDLHFLPFLQGMLYVGSEVPLSNEEIQVVQSLADAFSTAYARYEDFNKLESAKEQIEKTLVDLKQAQAQLVQSEKMASLGELTAGIAHEIQNPLNFVNNFSEVNTELLEELKAERLKPNAERNNTLQDELINDVIDNSEKINHHGKRAGDIVKGMLQHSRSSTGVKEPTDINALADEYLRLSYHGLRAKDKSFNAEMVTNFDETIGKINIIPQDIGRVLLNLYNNAFYAVNQQISQNLISYEPTVSVTTKKLNNHVIITVSDNGNGIPQNIVDKIFQPFFTTKPTGSGTGLGLSLSYDIVKAHGGEIKVESLSGGEAGKVGDGSIFIIELPV